MIDFFFPMKLAVQFRFMSLLAMCAFMSPAFAQGDGKGEMPLQIEAGSSLDTFDKSYMANWHSAYVAAEKKLGVRHTVYGTLRETVRFTQQDREMLAGMYYPLAERWTLLAEANASPTHKILGIWSGTGQIQYDFAAGMGVQLGMRHTEYDSAVANMLTAGGELYWSDYRAAYTHAVSSLANAGYASNDRVQLSWYYGDRSWSGIGMSQGAEIENAGPALGILRTAVRHAGLTGRHWLNRDWALSYEVSVNRQGDSYTRQGAGIGLRHQF